MPSTDTREQGIEPGDELNKLEMVANRPTPDPASETRVGKPGDPFRMARARSVTAAF